MEDIGPLNVKDCDLQIRAESSPSALSNCQEMYVRKNTEGFTNDKPIENKTPPIATKMEVIQPILLGRMSWNSKKRYFCASF